MSDGARSDGVAGGVLPIIGTSAATTASPPAFGGVPSAAALPRELTAAEVEALWSAATEDGRLALAALLAGLSAEELADLSWGDVDLAAGVLTVGGRSQRELTIPAALAETLAQRRGSLALGGGRVLSGGAGTEPTLGDTASAAHEPVLGVTADGLPLGARDVEGLVACAAHDAGLDRAVEITPAVLRHTYIAYLVRQGARLSEIERLIGRLPPAAYTDYGRLSPPGPGLPLTQIQTAYLDPT